MEKKSKLWQEEEDNIMKKNYGVIPFSEVVELLPNRTKKSIRLRALKLDLTNKDWTEDDIAFLKENHLKMTYTKIAATLKKSKSGVQQKATHLGLRKARPSSWSQEDLNFLTDNFNSKTYDEMQKHLKRSLPSIYNKAYELGLSSKDNKYQKLKFSHRQFILNNCHKMTDSELARKFGVSTDAIADLRKKNGITKKPNNQSNKRTLPEQIVEDFLNECNLNFEYNAPLNGYYPDFTVNDKYLIEVQGDYFHCNPRLYPNGPNEAQIEYIIKDYYKKCYYLGNNIPVLYVWEYDIVNDFSSVKKQISDFLSLT